MCYRTVAAVVLVSSVCVSSSALAQPAGPSGGRTGLWTSVGVGVGAGFGLGLWAGLTAFDDAVNSDRKVWTSAIVGAAAGGTLGYLLSRGRRQASPARRAAAAGGSRAIPLQAPALGEADVRALAGSVHLRR